VSERKYPDAPEKRKTAVSRRGFIRGVGVGGGALGTGVFEGEASAEPQGAGVKTAGPGPVPITLKINGKPMNLTVEPRVTLLDALRDHLDLTAAKRACDRGTCGSCTVIMGGKVVYACCVLAIEAQGKEILTLEGLGTAGKPHPIVMAFVHNDAQQCGYCTPGMVMATKGLLDRNPAPSMEQIERGLGGNLCRCGTYIGIRKAVLEASAMTKGGPNA